MKPRAILIALALLSSATVAYADDVKVRDHRHKKERARPVWDQTGWTRLGDQVVHGKHDRDTLRVGVAEGRFSKLTIVVEDSDLELHDIVITFGNGETFSPKTRHYFREDSATKVIDLPGEARFIKKIDFRYGNLPRGGKARVVAWGFAVKDTPKPPPPPPPPFSWDSKGWQLLGEQRVQGRRDRDVIRVGAYQGAFDQLTFVVADSDVEIKKVVVHFMNGKKFQPKVKHYFREGQRTRVIDLPGNNRLIKKIDLVYKNLGRDGAATVQVWGRDTRPPEKPFDPAGWTLLGDQTVKARKKRAVIKVGRNEGRFTRLGLVVEGADLEMWNVTIHFANGEKYSPSGRHHFRPSFRLYKIDLPGDARFVDKVVFKFGSKDDEARVRVYGKEAPVEPPPVAQPHPHPQPKEPPPAPRPERIGSKRGYIWVAGRWDWKAGNWEWVPGHWERRRAKQTWRDGRWELRGDVYVWVEGAWEVERPAVRDHRR